jgi:hypothetical protein
MAFGIHCVGFVVRVIPVYFAALYAPAWAIVLYVVSGCVHYLLYLLCIALVCRVGLRSVWTVIKDSLLYLAPWVVATIVMVVLPWFQWWRNLVPKV